jgi:hypothetical protein
MTRKDAAALVTALLFTTVLAVPVAHAAGVSIAIRKGPAITRVAQPDHDRLYSSDTTETMTAVCRRGESAIGAGWSGAGTFVGGAYARPGEKDTRGYVSLDPRETAIAGRTRALAICADTSVGATSRTSKGTTVNCGAGRLALGVVAPNGTPDESGPAEARATSESTWTSTLGDGQGAIAVCVKASAFKRVTTVTKTGAFAAGSPTATVTAACTGGRRPIGWGVGLPAMPGNTYKASGTLNKRVAPFPSTSAPSGASGWKTVFRTADFKPAAAAATVTLQLTCAVPR